MPLLSSIYYRAFVPAVCLCWLLAGWPGLVSCKKSNSANTAAQDSIYYGRLPFVMQDNDTYSVFTSGFQLTGLLDTLGSAGEFTVLLPNNDAINTGYLQQNEVANLTNFVAAIGGSNDDLVPYLKNAILKGAISFRALPLGDNQPLATLWGSTVYVTRYLSGSDTITTVNGQQTLSLDNPATNGWIQVMSGIPNPLIYSTAWQRITGDTSMAYFAFALQRAHLDTLLQGSGPFTVLAPTNRAFRATAGLIPGISVSTLDSIATADTVALRQLLSYHILPGRYFLNDFERRLTTDTLNVASITGEAVKFLWDPYGDVGNPGGLFPITPEAPAFSGPGNLSLPSSTYWYATIANVNNTVSTVGFFFENYGDWPENNGVVHTISAVLIP